MSRHKSRWATRETRRGSLSSTPRPRTSCGGSSSCASRASRGPSIARWTASYGRPMTKFGVSNLVANRVYLGEARQGRSSSIRPHTMHSLRGSTSTVPTRLACSRPVGARSGSMVGRSIVQGIARCGSCGLTLNVNVGRPRGREYWSLQCRNPHCAGRANIMCHAIDAEVERRLKSWAVRHDANVNEPAKGERQASRSSCMHSKPLRPTVMPFSRTPMRLTSLGEAVWNSTLDNYLSGRGRRSFSPDQC